MNKFFLTALIGCWGIGCVADDQALTLDELMPMFGWDFEATEIRSEKVGDGLFVLFGVGGNIAVSVGSDGVMIVDDQFPEMMDKINDAVATLAGSRRASREGPQIDYAINSHWHFDHAQGNLALGPAGTQIVAQSNARVDMARGGVVNLVVTRYGQDPYPPDALPSITFDDGMRFHYNDERIDLMHFGPAHTTGDVAVFFRNHNAVHLGDVFNNTGYPFIDADSGGDIDGMIAFCQQTLDQLEPGAVVIPGHGEITDTDALADYIAMLTTVRDRVKTLMDAGESLQDIMASNPTADYTDRYGEESASLGFIDRIYTSLAKKR
ncbi:MAG TPA: MBL fold metallo-hydrolase [Pseudomonadales bacterium]|jgi:cyclase|nr:MBL fold metallo-hydrolase [Gammaproteobacteria bacterium]HIM35635.1 MBL fold metallo-hydrolase [Pseudomonadales bacterium]